MPADRETIPKTSGDSWASLLSTWDGVLRVCFAYLVILALSTIAVIIVVYFLPSDAKVELRGYLTIVKSHGKPTDAALLLPANREWIDTGLNLNGDATIDCTGAVNLALLSSQKEPEFLPWVDAQGGDENWGRVQDGWRIPLLIDPSSGYGAVLGYIQTQSDPAPNPKTNPRPGNIIRIGKKRKISGQGELWLTINDLIVFQSGQLIDGKKDPACVYAGLLDCKNPRENSYAKYHDAQEKHIWERFFADNGGSFEVNIHLSSK